MSGQADPNGVSIANTSVQGSKGFVQVSRDEQERPEPVSENADRAILALNAAKRLPRRFDPPRQPQAR